MQVTMSADMLFIHLSKQETAWSVADKVFNPKYVSMYGQQSVEVHLGFQISSICLSV